MRRTINVLVSVLLGTRGLIFATPDGKSRVRNERRFYIPSACFCKLFELFIGF